MVSIRLCSLALAWSVATGLRTGLPRLGRSPVAAAAQSCRAAVSMSADVPSVIVGGGRIGGLLAGALGTAGDAVMRRGEPFPADAPASGPIYVCTRNDALDAVIEATPAERRKDLVFLQNGYLQGFLDGKGLGGATQVLVYLAVAKLGEDPTDGITEVGRSFGR